MYTLEKHLHNCSIESTDFEILNSIWNLNKKYIPNAQNAISFNFPHYSLHEKSHSDTIIKNIESFLGVDRILKLTPTDTWLILMSCYTHDLGMVVFRKTLEKKWHEDDFQKYLKTISEASTDFDLQKAANLLLKVQILNTSKNSNISLPLEIREAVILITADFFRRNHHYRSKEILLGNDEDFFQLIDGFNLKGLPGRFAEVLSEIAFAHGINFYTALNRLEYFANGYGSDKMHPRFVACLLRLGDLLDVDDSRFNIFNSKVLSQELPYSSKLHAEKHSAVKHLLISPKSIEVTVDCKGDDVYRVAREWFDWLQEEVKNQNTEWAQIAPYELQGLPPTISKGKIKVLYKSAEPQEELMNLRFAISNRKIFEMFEGAAIYKDPGFVFLREIIQNAIDASNLHIWKLFNAGYFDFHLKTHLELLGNTTHEDIIKSIIFPSDIPDGIWENFHIHLRIDWKDDKKRRVLVEISDNGTGISITDLIRMTHKVGESRSNDSEYQKFKEHMPYWLKPTGAFGIGLQSLFLVTNKFTVQTKADNEPPKEIEFYSAKKGEYSRITGDIPKMARGTKMIFEIPIDTLEDIFPSQIMERYDIFSSEYENQHLHNMAYYIRNEFSRVDLLDVTYFGNRIKKPNANPSNKIKNKYYYPNNKDRKYLITSLSTSDDIATYTIHDANKIGCEIKITFLPNKSFWSLGNITNYVRDMPVGETELIIPLRYASIQVNYKSPESDKILNISRSEFINKEKSKYNMILIKEVIPDTLPLIISDFENTYKNNDKESIAKQYFHLELTAELFKIAVNHKIDIYGNFSLPTDLICKNDFSSLKYIDFFKAKKIIGIGYENRRPNTLANILEVFKKIKGDFEEYSDGIIVLSDKPYFNPYLIKTMFFVETNNRHIIQSETILEVNILTRRLKENAYLPVTRNAENVLKPIRGTSRGYIPAFDSYSYDLAVKMFQDIEETTSIGSHYILSPFKNGSEYRELTSDIANTLKVDTLSKKTISDYIEKIKEIIKRSHIDELVPDKMLNWIVLNSSMQKPSLDNDQLVQRKNKIKEKYLDLILEILQNDINND